ncbi:RidA family protein [Hyphobacterium sp.]|uniref:RidA family protein n=1 Tax=Hyphobacterium sp. TaxID=2004662 RepID=UPI003BAB7279
MVERIYSGAVWENRVGYRRAIKDGPHIWVSGTVAVDEDGQVYAPGDMEAQTRRCLEIIEKALEKLGASMRNVRRTRVFVTDMSPEAQAAFARAHSEVFRDFPPASALYGISALAAPEFLVEIEADAYLGGGK